MAPWRAEIGDAIVDAAREVIEGQYSDAFPVDRLAQMGAGTSANMNMNEGAGPTWPHLKLGGALDDEKKRVSPNDHVNMGQSTNDVIPTTIRIAALKMLERKLLPALKRLEGRVSTEGPKPSPTPSKPARTHMMDAVGTTLGNEFGGYVMVLREAREGIEYSAGALKRLGIGGTAAGTGVNAAPGLPRESGRAPEGDHGLRPGEPPQPSSPQCRACCP